MSKLLDEIRLQPPDPKGASKASTQVNHETVIRLEDLDKLADAVEQALPGCVIHQAQIDGAWKRPDGRPACVYAVIQRSAGRTRSVSVFDTGSVSWVGMDPVFPVPSA